jgi:cytoskeletal protein RodZ
MAENNEVDISPKSEGSKERVGDLLRKERVTRRIAVEAIARDLKLNAKYIKLIEENRRDGLPSPPYVRVYIRSLARYLQLDPETMVKRYYDELGMGEEFSRETDTSTRIAISMSSSARKINTRPWLLPLIIIILLVIFLVVAQRMGLVHSPVISAPEQPPAADSEITLGSEEPAEPPPSVLKTPERESDEPLSAEHETPDSAHAGKKLALRISSLADSVWVQVFTDGKSWKNYFFADQTKYFYASDSFNVHVGRNEIVRYSLNGVPLKIDGNGVVVFCIKGKKHEFWTLSKWQRVFKDRI